MASEADWTWKFTQRAADQFDILDPHIQDRIVTKLDEVVESEWREPSGYLDPLTGGPFSKLRIGQYRLACVLDDDAAVLEVHRIEHRRGAYTADDWRLERLRFRVEVDRWAAFLEPTTERELLRDGWRSCWSDRDPRFGTGPACCQPIAEMADDRP